MPDPLDFLSDPAPKRRPKDPLKILPQKRTRGPFGLGTVERKKRGRLEQIDPGARGNNPFASRFPTDR